MDLGRSPTSVLLGQAPDQLTNLLRDLRSSAARPGAPTPVEAETSAVPADDGGRFDDDEDLGPAGPIATQAGPKNSVQPVSDGPWPFAFQHRDLLPEGQHLQRDITPTVKENSEG